ncbi:MAG: hypothetical protein ACFCUN_00055 [Hyphomicrobiaceae bacterium]
MLPSIFQRPVHLSAPPQQPVAVALLAEHLDQVLAAGEDLARLSFDGRSMCASGIANRGPLPSLDAFVADVQQRELTCHLRVMRARERAEDLAEADPRFADIVRLFLAGTSALVEVTGALSRHASVACPVTYLRTRGALDPTATGPSGFVELRLSEAYRIGGVVELGPLMDLAATFLDALELHYEVFAAVSPSAA